MQSGNGVSFAEFTYPLLQAWDWWYMYNTKGTQLQIGGSDQFGNIIAGMDGINHIRKTHYDPKVRQEKDDPLMRPMGFTVPLLTTSAGEKFGKSAGNAVWLDKEMTSTFELYQV
jgi:tyrosyl-tRNA synthetase